MTHVVVATRELANRIDPVVVALLVGFAVLALLAPL